MRAPLTTSRRSRSLLLVTLIAITAAVLTTVWSRVAISRASAPVRTEPLAAARLISPETPMPLPIVQADRPTAGDVAAIPATTAPAPTPALEAELIITSEPSGARVTVDGIARGVTPVTVRHLSAGDRRVRLTMAGFAADERSVQIPENRSSTSLHVGLTAIAPK